MNAKSTKALESPVKFLKGIGEKRAEQLAAVGVNNIRDLLYYFPRRYLDRSHITPIKNLRPNTEATIVGRIESRGIKSGRKARFMAIVFDGTGFLTCVWFNQVKYWDNVFQAGDMVAFSGKVTIYGGPQMVHPDYDILSDEEEPGDQFLHTGIIIPLYPSTELLGKVGMDSRGFRRTIKGALKLYGDDISEILSSEILQRQNLISLKEAIAQVHFPSDMEHLSQALRRLKYDELFYLELMLAFRKRYITHQTKGIQFKEVGEKIRRLAGQLPFELTAAQKRVMHEIRADMKSDKVMYRLVQGDVGSGKTIIALLNMLIAAENGYQSALMAPTEILAEQHYFNIQQFLENMDVRVELLVGALSRSRRMQRLEAIRSGEVDIVVGTHALIQEDIEFKKLGLVIVDEQHRFGVMQRAALVGKGLNPDVLIMTATPIPRTLSMTLYGDLDVSVIDELPKGRLPIKTAWRYDNKRNEIYDFVRKQVLAGRQAYIVFPLVEESEKVDLHAATESFEKLSTTIFPDVQMALLHGRMDSETKEQVMTDFKNGKIRVLVSTTVIEVGVDVPNATIMVIEHAERFGLTQLHQLRGRVGRGNMQSYCILIAVPPLSDEAQKRLNTMAETNDGFKISEVDLEIRGPGEFFGTKQHGLPELKVADILKDKEILSLARQEAFALVEKDPQLLQEDARPIREHFVKYFKDKFDLVQIG